MEITGPVRRTDSGRRYFSIEFQLQYLQAWDEAAVIRGARTRLLRKYGLDTSTVRAWREKRESGYYEEQMVAEASKPKGRDRTATESRAEIARLSMENDRLRKKVAQAEAAQEIMGKAYELLEGITTSSEPMPYDKIPPALMSAEQYRAWLNKYRFH